MPGLVVHLGATVMCMHAGQAAPTNPFPRVLVSGQPVVTIATTYAVAGCGLATTSMPPCLTGRWLVGATRVLAGGAPVAVQTGGSMCAPSSSPMLPLVVQPRVVAT
jgi:hypothetical protein